jgi:hypothetical protein
MLSSVARLALPDKRSHQARRPPRCAIRKLRPIDVRAQHASDQLLERLGHGFCNEGPHLIPRQSPDSARRSSAVLSANSGAAVRWGHRLRARRGCLASWRSRDLLSLEVLDAPDLA